MKKILIGLFFVSIAHASKPTTSRTCYDHIATQECEECFDPACNACIDAAMKCKQAAAKTEDNLLVNDPFDKCQTVQVKCLTDNNCAVKE